MLAQESQFIPVATLENNLTRNDMEESTASKPERISPFEDRPFTILENILNDADHFCRGKTSNKHVEDCCSSLNRRFRDLVIDRGF